MPGIGSSEIKEAIINAYAAKTGLPRNKLSKLMDCETWMSANKAIELGFADGLLYETGQDPADPTVRNAACGFLFDRLTVTNALMRKLPRPNAKAEPRAETDAQASPSSGIPVDQLEKRMALLRH